MTFVRWTVVDRIRSGRYRCIISEIIPPVAIYSYLQISNVTTYNFFVESRQLFSIVLNFLDQQMISLKENMRSQRVLAPV